MAAPQYPELKGCGGHPQGLGLLSRPGFQRTGEESCLEAKKEEMSGLLLPA